MSRTSALKKELTALAEQCDEFLQKFDAGKDLAFKLADACDQVGASWSDCYEGPNARVYLKGFKPRTVEIYDNSLGFSDHAISRTRGDWQVQNDDDVVAECYRVAGTSDYASVEELYSELLPVARKLHARALGIFERSKNAVSSEVLNASFSLIQGAKSSMSIEDVVKMFLPEKIYISDPREQIVAPRHQSLKAWAISSAMPWTLLNTISTEARKCAEYFGQGSDDQKVYLEFVRPRYFIPRVWTYCCETLRSRPMLATFFVISLGIALLVARGVYWVWLFKLEEVPRWSALISIVVALTAVFFNWLKEYAPDKRNKS